MPTREELGRRLKSVRLARGMTLKDVEVRSGISMTHTSKIERGLASPTVNALEKLARALDKTLAYFVEDAELSEVSVVRKGERPMLAHETEGITVEALSRGVPGGTLYFYYVTAAPGNPQTRREAHGGEECAIVVRGCIEIAVGEERHTLRHGESIHFKSKDPVTFRNPGRTPAEIIWGSTQTQLF
jgi:transcriptional regulator with XRE-family HTH domain